MKIKIVLITCIACILPMLFGIIVYDQLPEQMPIHWNISGEVDSYANKAITVFGLPLMMAALQLFCLFMIRFDPKRKNYSVKMKSVVVWIIPVMSVFLEGITYAIVFGYDISINTVLPIFIGMIFIVFGNYMPKCRQNYTIGIKLPWTLNDEDNWNKTNRLGGFIMVTGGILIIVMSLFDQSVVAMAIVIPSFLVIPVIYSFINYRKKL